LAKKYEIFLHAHVDSDAIHRIFKHNPDALVLWAHSGFDNPDEIRSLLEKYPNLWSDLAFRNEHVLQDQVSPDWQELFNDFPDRFVLGTDTYTPERCLGRLLLVRIRFPWSGARSWGNPEPLKRRENSLGKPAGNTWSF
ncbi:MAG: amidohydrolase, partial [Candidatus Poribacteria bacterium]